MLKKEFKFSKVALIFTLAVTLFMNLKNERWIKGDVIASDMNWYYIYLPAIFIYHDITFNYINKDLPEEVYKRSWVITNPEGKNPLSKVTCGYAEMLMPFFFVAHGYELLTGKDANGYSTSYAFMICLATFFYLMIALLYQRKILLHFFDERTSGITIIILGLATNIYIYSTYSFSNVHIFSFCLLTILVWKSIQWHKQPTYASAIIIGFVVGLSALVRPTTIIAALFPLLYSMQNKNSLLMKVRLLKNNWKHLIVLVLAIIAGVIPQLMIWKIQVGEWIHYSYYGERFYFNHPHIVDGLFSFRNGFFIYTPVMLLILPGFYIAWKRKEKFAFALPVLFAVNCYVIYSWWCWWFGGSFGSRGMIEAYALLALPLGSTIQAALQKNIFTKYAIVILLAGFTFLNQFQTLQSQSNLLHYSDMSWEAYKKIFLRLSYPEGWEESLSHPDVWAATEGKPERSFAKSFPFLKGRHVVEIALKTSNGKFVRTDSLNNGVLIADVETEKDAGRFVLTMIEYGISTFTSVNNKKYLTAQLDSSGKIIANSNINGAWQQFFLVELDDNKYALRACNENYIRPNAANKNILEAADNKILAEDRLEIFAK